MIILRKQTESQKGQMLIEALLALAFAVVIITAVVIAVITSLNNTSFTKNQNLAAQYAQEGLDIARNMKDSNYSGFRALPNGGYYCVNKINGTLSDIGFCPPVEEFSRQIYVDHGTSSLGGRDENGRERCEVGSSFVASIVSWGDSKCEEEDTQCHSIQLDSCFSNLN